LLLFELVQGDDLLVLLVWPVSLLHGTLRLFVGCACKAHSSESIRYKNSESHTCLPVITCTSGHTPVVTANLLQYIHTCLVIAIKSALGARGYYTNAYFSLTTRPTDRPASPAWETQ
jgi:hypothetical protein